MGKSRRSRATRVAARSTAGPKSSLGTRTRAFITGLLPVLAIFICTNQLLAATFHIPSGSMEPTIRVGDRIWVNRLRFGPHVPFTTYTLPGYARPQRDDVAVFVSPPQDASIRISPNQVTPLLIKRIVGVAGDTLLMRDGELSRNGVVVPALNTNVLPDEVTKQPQRIFAWQRRIEAHGSRFGPPPQDPSLHEWGPLVVPSGTYFMLGDNRDFSVDSRYYGPVPRANLRGSPMFVYYSYDKESGVDYLRAVTAIRWRRLGTWIR